MRKPPDYNTLSTGNIYHSLNNHLHSIGHWEFSSTMPNKNI